MSQNNLPKNKVIETIDNSIFVISESKKLADKIEQSAKIITDCLKHGNKVIVFGNGGSAADAQHFAAEFVGRYKTNRRSLPAIALTTDTSIITAIGNDFGFDNIFSRQCESFVEKDDVVVAISTSGMSTNVLDGVSLSKKKGAYVIGLTGNGGGNLHKNCDILIDVPSKDTPRIQEVHRIILHILCDYVDEYFSNDIANT